MKQWLARWTTWEYWPWWFANIPVYGFWLWYALRSRHLFFFSNVNPLIPIGGVAGESKYDILKSIPAAVLPRMVFFPAGAAPEAAPALLLEAGISYPLILKPDVGERGFLVQKIENEAQLLQSLRTHSIDLIAQEFLTHPAEMSVLFHRRPDTDTVVITSVCIKDFLKVCGDGRSSVRQLMGAQVRAGFQLERFEKEKPELMAYCPAAGETLLLEPIGNHARGTKFLNGNHLIDEQLTAAFAPVCKAIEGVYYGRFDLKCASPEALARGEFKVMELNGVLGEPAHVYDPTYGMWRAYRDYWRHWRILFEISRIQRRRGVKYWTHRAAFRFIGNYFAYKKRLES
jgi:hypothetical protein